LPRTVANHNRTFPFHHGAHQLDWISFSHLASRRLWVSARGALVNPFLKVAEAPENRLRVQRQWLWSYFHRPAQLASHPRAADDLIEPLYFATLTERIAIRDDVRRSQGSAGNTSLLRY
jgi:hypothetical protein